MDSNLSDNVDSWSLMSQMLNIVKPYMPVPGHPLGNEIEDAILRELMSTCISISLANLGHKSAAERQAFARKSVALFDVKGWKYFPGLKEASTSTLGSGGGHDDDLQPGTSKWMKQTGLESDGTTCFQNSAFFALVSSPPFMRRLMNSDQGPSDADVFSEAYELAARNILGGLLKALRENRKQDSLKLLHRFWAAQNEAPEGSALSVFRPGDHHDPGEFLLTCLSPMLPGVLGSVWGFNRVEEMFCSRCHGRRERLEKGNVSLNLPVANRGTLDFVPLLNHYLLNFESRGELLLDCDRCGKCTYHACASKVDRVAKGDMLISLSIPEPVLGSTGMTNVDTHVGLPFGAFPIAGPDCLFFIRYIIAYKGRTPQDRHFFGFGRDPLSCARRRPYLEVGGALQEAAVIGEGEQAEENTFTTFRRYDDACLTSNVSCETVAKEMPYQVLVSPVSPTHFEALCLREIVKLRTNTVTAIASALESRARSPTARFHLGTIFAACATELSTIFERVAGRELDKLKLKNQPVVTVGAAIWEQVLGSPHLAGRISERRREKMRAGKGIMHDLFDTWIKASVIRGWSAAVSIEECGLAAACLHDIVFVPEVIAAFLREVAHDHIRLQRETQRRRAVREWKMANPRAEDAVAEGLSESNAAQSEAPTESLPPDSLASPGATVDQAAVISDAVVDNGLVGATATQSQSARASGSRRSELRLARDSLFAVGRHLVRGLTTLGQKAKEL
ncbi:hypothetical protein LTR56_019194 [Elasticomyces elasticus]|nr:hypothetical protein LTR56_019194 [Elasticomyces elasticus]KAK3642684.1 hypothetical protein LTR22_015939 [Elasticomyces elasticus]KAK4905163.1 hypothetical protein LTR49_025511 [Elasticomyces elasticus]KAK5738109.1 hypothetical protein LTS12_025683 [Elasticomyces elasticus]